METEKKIQFNIQNNNINDETKIIQNQIIKIICGYMDYDAILKSGAYSNGNKATVSPNGNKGTAYPNGNKSATYTNVDKKSEMYIPMPLYDNNIHKLDDGCWNSLSLNKYVPFSWFKKNKKIIEFNCLSHYLVLNANVPLSYLEDVVPFSYYSYNLKLMSKYDIPSLWFENNLDRMYSSCKTLWMQSLCNPNIPLSWLKNNRDKLDDECFNNLCANTNRDILIWILNYYLDDLNYSSYICLFNNSCFPMDWLEESTIIDSENVKTNTNEKDVKDIKDSIKSKIKPRTTRNSNKDKSVDEITKMNNKYNAVTYKNKRVIKDKIKDCDIERDSDKKDSSDKKGGDKGDGDKKDSGDKKDKKDGGDKKDNKNKNKINLLDLAHYNSNTPICYIDQSIDKIEEKMPYNVLKNANIPFSWIEKYLNKKEHQYNLSSLYTNPNIPLSWIESKWDKISTSYYEVGQICINTGILPEWFEKHMNIDNQYYLSQLCINTGISFCYLERFMSKYLAEIIFSCTNDSPDTCNSDDENDRTNSIDSDYNKIDTILNKIIDWYKNYEFTMNLTGYNYTRDKNKKRKIKSNSECLISYTREFQKELPNYLDLYLQGIRVLINIINQYCRDYYPITPDNLKFNSYVNSLSLLCPFCFTRYKKNGEPYANALGINHSIDNFGGKKSEFSNYYECKISEGDIISITAFDHGKEAMGKIKMFDGFIVRHSID